MFYSSVYKFNIKYKVYMSELTIILLVIIIAITITINTFMICVTIASSINVNNKLKTNGLKSSDILKL